MWGPSRPGTKRIDLGQNFVVLGVVIYGRNAEPIHREASVDAWVSPLPSECIWRPLEVKIGASEDVF